MSAALLTEISRGPTESDRAGLSHGDPLRSGSSNIVSSGDSPAGLSAAFPASRVLENQTHGRFEESPFSEHPHGCFSSSWEGVQTAPFEENPFSELPTGRFLYLLATLLRNASSAGICAYLGWGRLESLVGFLRTLSLTERFLPACGVLLSPLRPSLDRRVLGFGGQGKNSPPGTLPPLRPLPDHPFLVLPLPTQPTAILLLRPPLFRVLRGTRGP
jgi:hypothetical protein